MSLDLTVANSFTAGAQVVRDQDNASSALTLSSNLALVKGQDIVGGAMPLTVQGLPVGPGEQTWGRLIRLTRTTPPNAFFDIGIDENGNLFLNGPDSTATDHILTISPTGVITIG